MTEYDEDDHIKQLQKELKALRNFPVNTTPASRHLELMADSLAVGDGYSMFQEDPKHCAITMYAVLIGFYHRKASSVSRPTCGSDSNASVGQVGKP